MQEITVGTVVIGSGCAGFNAADWLYDLGQKDVLLLTEGINWGTSRNTGSDKQTYYKMSLSGDEGDSVGQMARTLHYEDTHGDTALCEAAASVPCFLKLVRLGVPFPRNEYGEYVGYQTDHDTFRRASSVGPLTSKFMTEALEKSVRSKGIAIMDHVMAVKLLTGEKGIRGVLGLNIRTNEKILIRCAHAVLCTGGPAQVYRDSVFPESQRGSSSLALEAGAKGANLHCWQYGLASVQFRWNVSGSYQQALPRFVSVDGEGNEHDFLLKSLSPEKAMALCFLKGYQWPFDPEKVPGSSQIDLLIKAETDQGRKVYMDYRRNPTGFSMERLTDEARNYLAQCGAEKETPIERLRAINAPAIALYAAHGIDLEKDMLEIKVCAQHHSGGIGVDANWESCVPGLYVCGEAAGTFGKRRPGGTALNSTQAGSMRAAEHIAESCRKTDAAPLDASFPPVPSGDIKAITKELQAEMSRCAAFQKDRAAMERLKIRVEEALASCIPADEKDPALAAKLRLRDLMITQRAILSAMLLDMEGHGPGVIETDGGESRIIPARPLPERDLWFERVWKKQQEKKKA